MKQFKMWAIPWDGERGKAPVENGVYALFSDKEPAQDRMIGKPVHVIVTIKKIKAKAAK